jgi:hypothetical protein
MSEELDATARMVRLEVREQLDARLSAEFDAKSTKLVERYEAETERLRSVARKATAFVSATIFGALGIGAITYIVGMPAQIKNTVLTEIKREVVSNDVRSKYNARIQQIYAESLAAHVASKNPNSQPTEFVNRRTPIKAKSTTIEYPLSLPDTLLLLSVLLEPLPEAPLSDDIYERVTHVFSYAKSEAAAVFKLRVLEALQLWLFGNASENEKWGRVFENPKRVTALVVALGFFVEEDADGVVSERLRALLRADLLPRQVRVTILQYLLLSTTVGETGSRQVFRTAADSPDPQVRDLGIAGLSMLDPADKHVKSFIAELGSGWIAPEQLRSMEGISTSLCWAYRQGKSEAAALDRLSEILNIEATKTLGWVRQPRTRNASDAEPPAEVSKAEVGPKVAVARGRDGFVVTEVAHPMSCYFAVASLFESALANGDKAKVLSLIKTLRIRRFDRDNRTLADIPEELPKIALAEPRVLSCDGRDVKLAEGTDMLLNVVVRNGVEDVEAHVVSGDAQARPNRCVFKPNDAVRAKLGFRSMW